MSNSLLFYVVVLSVLLCSVMSQDVSNPLDVIRFFNTSGKTVVTFVGYSGAGYEDEDAMIKCANEALSQYSVEETFINIGATVEGIGAVYKLASDLGFYTTGIVSSLALQYHVPVSPDVQKVFFVNDTTWGGFVPGSEPPQLESTSEANVGSTHEFVAIGGGPVARDELIAGTKREGKPMKFFEADMNHEKAFEKAKQKGLPPPTPFELKGAVYDYFYGDGSNY